MFALLPKEGQVFMLNTLAPGLLQGIRYKFSVYLQGYGCFFLPIHSFCVVVVAEWPQERVSSSLKQDNEKKVPFFYAKAVSQRIKKIKIGIIILRNRVI